MARQPTDGDAFWDHFQEAREGAERRLLDQIEVALRESPRASAELLRGWLKGDVAKKSEKP